MRGSDKAQDRGGALKGDTCKRRFGLNNTMYTSRILYPDGFGLTLVLLLCYAVPNKVNGRSRRNLFYAGLGRLQLGDRKGATEAFRCASSDELSEFASPVERDIAVPIRREVQKGLEFTTRSG